MRRNSRGGQTQMYGGSAQTGENSGWVSNFMNSNLAIYQTDVLNDFMSKDRPRWWPYFQKFSRNYLVKLRGFTYGAPLPNSELQSSLSMDNVFKYLW
mmetsp:Transcript_10040/g.15293  ORF Transcript_10040/g.15293 Transcript_10040/m.15293 type:complete len:97 (+) Transcript_10040:3563-3853(+)